MRVVRPHRYALLDCTGGVGSDETLGYRHL
jgi:hypothetical protein